MALRTWDRVRIMASALGDEWDGPVRIDRLKYLPMSNVPTKPRWQVVQNFGDAERDWIGEGTTQTFGEWLEEMVKCDST